MRLEPADQSVWLASNKQLVQLNKQGQIIKRIEVKNRIKDIALYSDVIPPLIRFIYPEDGDWLKDNQPALQLGYEDNGIGVDTASLVIAKNGTEPAISCAHVTNHSTCHFIEPLPEGAMNLQATVSDFAGNAPKPAEINITVDTVPPVITVFSPQQDTYTNIANITLKGILNEAGSVTVNYNNSSVTSPSLDAQFNFQSNYVLVEGVNSFAITAVDIAGNITENTYSIILDTVAPVPPVQAKINLSEVINGVSVTAQSGAVEGGAWVDVSNTTTGETVRVHASSEGGFNATINASPGDTISLAVFDRAGNASEAITRQVPQPLSIAIISPVVGAVIKSDTVNVEGIFKGPMNTGITINGQAAEVSPRGVFILNALPLKKGINTLDVVLTTLDGDSVTKTISISSKGEIQPFSFEPDFSSGPAPFNVEFEFSWHSRDDIKLIEVDYEGDGVVDETNYAEKESFLTTYTQPGVYHPRITITTETATYQQQLILRVFDKAEIIEMLTLMWKQMNEALAKGDIEHALTYMDTQAKEKFLPVFEALSDKMPAIIQSYSNIQLVEIFSSTGEFAINRMQNGRNHIYFVYYLKNNDGVWRLNAM